MKNLVVILSFSIALNLYGNLHFNCRYGNNSMVFSCSEKYKKYQFSYTSKQDGDIDLTDSDFNIENISKTYNLSGKLKNHPHYTSFYARFSMLESENRAQAFIRFSSGYEVLMPSHRYDCEVTGSK